MPRKLRMEYPGAIYHIVHRGDPCEDIFKDDLDRRQFLSTLGEARQKTERQGLKEEDLPILPKGYKNKVALARRLQPETTMKLKMESAKTARGMWTYVSNLLHEPQRSICVNTEKTGTCNNAAMLGTDPFTLKSILNKAAALENPVLAFKERLAKPRDESIITKMAGKTQFEP